MQNLRSAAFFRNLRRPAGLHPRTHRPHNHCAAIFAVLYFCRPADLPCSFPAFRSTSSAKFPGSRGATVKLIRPALSFLSVGLLAILTACGGGGGGSSTPVVTISGASGTIAPNGTFNLTASVTGDSTNSGVSWTISPASGSGTLSNESTIAATYTAPSSVPASPSVTITATSIANSQGSNSVTFLIQQPTVQVPQYLNGQYAFVMSGFDSSGNPLTVGGSITANGGGSITDGVIDVNDNLNNTTTSTPVTGTYTLDSNLRGTIKITNALQGFSATPTFSFTLDSTTNTGNIISLDPSLPAISGTIDKQQAAAFNAIPSGSFIFRAYSDNPVRASMVGRVNVLGGGRSPTVSMTSRIFSTAMTQPTKPSPELLLLPTLTGEERYCFNSPGKPGRATSTTPSARRRCTSSKTEPLESRTPKWWVNFARRTYRRSPPVHQTALESSA